jgi:hypothetical protein
MKFDDTFFSSEDRYSVDEFLHNSAAAIALVGGGNTMACSSNDRAVTVVLRYKSGSVPCQH